MHGTINHTARNAGASLTEDATMFALQNELYLGQTVSYQGQNYALLLIQRGLAFLAGLANPVPADKLVQVR